MLKPRKSVHIAIVLIVLSFFLVSVVNFDFKEKRLFNNLPSKDFLILEIPSSFNPSMSDEIINIASKNSILLERTTQVNSIDGDTVNLKYYSFPNISYYSEYINSFTSANLNERILSTVELEGIDNWSKFFDFLNNDNIAFGLLEDYYNFNAPRGIYKAYYSDQIDFENMLSDLSNISGLNKEEFKSKITVMQDNPLNEINLVFLVTILFLYLLLFLIVCFDILSQSKRFAVCSLLGISIYRSTLNYFKNIFILICSLSGLLLLLSIFFLRTINFELQILQLMIFLISLFLTTITIGLSSYVVNKNHLSNLLKNKRVTEKLMTINTVFHLLTVGLIIFSIIPLNGINNEVKITESKFKAFEEDKNISVIYDFNPGEDGPMFLMTDEFDESQKALYKTLFDNSEESVVYVDFSIFNCKWVIDEPCYQGEFYKGIVNKTYLLQTHPELWKDEFNIGNNILIPDNMRNNLDEIIRETTDEFGLESINFEFYSLSSFKTLSPDVAYPDDFIINEPIMIILNNDSLNYVPINSFGGGFNTPMKLVIQNKVEWYNNNLNILSDLELSDNITIKNIDSISDHFSSIKERLQQLKLFIEVILLLMLIVYFVSAYQYVKLYVQNNTKLIAVKQLFGFSFNNMIKDLLLTTVTVVALEVLFFNILNYIFFSSNNSSLGLFSLLFVVFEIITITTLFKVFIKTNMIETLKGD